MPDGPPVDDVERAWAVVEDVEGEVAPWVERLDIERLLRAAQFVASEYTWGWMWEHRQHNLKYPTYKGTDRSPTTAARWLVGEVKQLGLLPGRPGPAGEVPKRGLRR